MLVGMHGKKSNKTPAILLAALLLAGTPLPLFAGMDDFRNSVEEAEAASEAEEPVTEETASDGDSSGLGELIFELLCYAWVANNLTVSYGDYPFEDDRYIRHPVEYPDESAGMLDPAPGRGTPWSFQAETQPFYLDGIGGGSWFTFKGNLWRFFGPYLEACVIGDGEDFIEGARLGGTFSLVQTNPFTLSLYAQFQVWNGMLERTGGTFGIETALYLAKPVSLHFRGGIQNFGTFQIGEAELKAGVFAGPWEFTGGWRWWTLETSGGSEIDNWYGPFCGAAYWF
jgi:hypothetical protein